MGNETATANGKRTIGRTVVDAVRTDGAAFVLAAAAFFLGSAALTRSGQPGASTPVPWMTSHASWVVATAFVAAGTVRTVRRRPALRAGVAGHAAGGAFGLGVLHALQWTAWAYVDVVAYRHGGHGRLLEPLLHPFGTGHALMYGVLVGAGVTSLAWALTRTAATPRPVDRAGIAVGATTILAATASLLTVAPVRSPTGLVTIALLAVAFGWLFVLGIVLHRNAEGKETGEG